MSEGNTSQGFFSKSRTVLGDVTNCSIVKRQVFDIEKNGIKAFDVNDKDLGKRARVVLPRSCTEINSLKGNVISSIGKIDVGVVSTSVDVVDNVASVSNGIRNSMDVGIEGEGFCGKLDLSKGEVVVGSSEVLLEREIVNVVDDCNVDGFVLSQSGSVDFTILPESEESRVFEADRSAEVRKGEECANMSGGMESIHTCSCSFCTKAAYIWTDLNYQDVKARVSAIKKSQKEATILAERSIRNKATEKHVAESSTRNPKLESHLMNQWRSLFQHMSNVWDKEANQLGASLLPLTDLREKCKTNMESNDTMPPEKH